MADHKAEGEYEISGNFDEATYRVTCVMTFDDEDECVTHARKHDVKCYHCGSKYIDHTDRKDGPAYFCCGASNDDHSECGTCFVCGDCGEPGSEACDVCGEVYCDDCHAGAHDDDDEDDSDDEEDEDETPASTAVPEPEVVEAREDGADFDDRLYRNAYGIHRLMYPEGD